MHTRTRSLRIALLRSLALLPLAWSGTGELKLKDADHKKLGQEIAKYYTALDETKGIQEALSKVIEALDKADKKLKKGEKTLAAVGDLEKVFWYVQLERLEGDLKKGKVEELKTLHPNGMEVAITYSVPKGYRPDKNGPYPLVLIVADEGEAPAAQLEANWNDPAARESTLLVAIHMPENTGSWGTFGTVDAPGGVFAVMSALGVVQRQLAIDMNRVYLAGSGRGFAAVGATATAFPHVFAGLIGIGDVPEVDPKNFRNLPLLIVKGGEGATAIQTKATELGFEKCSLLPEGGQADVWTWLGQTTRDAYPKQLSFAPSSDYAKRTYWIGIDNFQVGENPSVSATTDREANTITIEAQKISRVVVYLNDLLVDMDKPIKVLVNGNALREELVARNAPRMIDMMQETGDWGRVFTNYVSLDVP